MHASTLRITGDLNFYYAFGSPVAIINSRKVADDLLEKRGAIYSSRPTRTMMGDLSVIRFSISVPDPLDVLRSVEWAGHGRLEEWRTAIGGRSIAALSRNISAPAR